jgi:N6-L-threonylcarbamoyladenine synthase
MAEPVYILGMDTSCDDTSAAVIREGKTILSNVVSSQSGIHGQYGGIVPELASRKHIEMIWPVVHEALGRANLSLEDIKAIAVCYGPGLIGSLLVGCLFAKSLCYSKGVPLIGVNHLEGHVFTSFLAERAPEFPFLSLVVSGGHTSLYRIDGFRRYRELGRTRDDAAGEAYDKVAKMLGLGYPGGPVIDRLAGEGNPGVVGLPRPYLPGSLDFSFSGLKTAVRNFVSRSGEDLSRAAVREKQDLVKDICASFQNSIVDVLVRKTEWALKQEKLRQLTLAGGVAANGELRKRMKEMAGELGIELFIPALSLCTDNAAMIAAAGYFHFKNENFSDMSLNPLAYLPLAAGR